MHHARLCPWAGAQVAQHQPLILGIPFVRKRLSTENTAENGVSSVADLDLWIDIFVPAGELGDTSILAHSHKGLLANETVADPQAAMHLRPYVLRTYVRRTRYLPW